MDDEEEIPEENHPSFKETVDKGLDEMMGAAWKEVKDDFSGGTTLDKVASSAKLIGKGSLFFGVKFIQNIPAALQRANELNSKKN